MFAFLRRLFRRRVTGTICVPPRTPLPPRRPEGVNLTLPGETIRKDTAIARAARRRAELRQARLQQLDPIHTPGVVLFPDWDGTHPERVCSPVEAAESREGCCATPDSSSSPEPFQSAGGGDFSGAGAGGSWD